MVFNVGNMEVIQGPILRPAAAAEYLGISIAGFYAHVSDGVLPPLVKIGPRAVGVPKSWLDAYIVRQAKLSIGG